MPPHRRTWGRAWASPTSARAGPYGREYPGWTQLTGADAAPGPEHPRCVACGWRCSATDFHGRCPCCHFLHIIAWFLDENLVPPALRQFLEERLREALLDFFYELALFRGQELDLPADVPDFWWNEFLEDWRP